MESSEAPLKRCPACKEAFPATTEFFHRDKWAKSGLKSRCRACEKERQKNPEMREHRRLQSKEYRSRPEVRAHRRVREKAYRHGPKGQKIRQAVERKSRSRPEYKAKARIQMRVYIRTYQKKPEVRIQRRANGANREARKKSVAGMHTPQQIREQYDRQKGKCYYCRKSIKWGKHQADHTFPISRVAGTDIPANDISYLVITCPTCNVSKGDKFPWEWPEGGRLL